MNDPHEQEAFDLWVMHNGLWPWHTHWQLFLAGYRAAMQSPDVQTWKKNAERYRHATKPESDGSVDICITRVDWACDPASYRVLTGKLADAEIDLAMEKYISTADGLNQ
jgi:hypothetical protein